jgi:aldose 1-epimerase
MRTTYEGYTAIALRSPAGIEAIFAPAVGMVGCSLRHEGEELLAQRGGLARYEATGSTFGIPLLHPWANRLGATEYEAGGQDVKIAVDSPFVRVDPNGLPIHGLLAASHRWEVTEAADDHLSASLDFGARPELLELFPFPHDLQMDVRVTDTTLSIETTLTPDGNVSVPIAFGYHPYLRLPGVARADWRIELPVTRRLLPDERMIPTGESEDARIPPGPLGDRAFDDAYTDLQDPPVFAVEGGGRRIEVRFGPGYPFAQIYAPAGQDLICFEPMTAPTNALVSGRDLRYAEPGGSFAARFEVAVTG